MFDRLVVISKSKLDGNLNKTIEIYKISSILRTLFKNDVSNTFDSECKFYKLSTLSP